MRRRDVRRRIHSREVTGSTSGRIPCIAKAARIEVLDTVDLQRHCVEKWTVELRKLTDI